MNVFTLVIAMFLFLVSLTPRMTLAQREKMMKFGVELRRVQRESHDTESNKNRVEKAIRNVRSKLRLAEPGRPHITVSINGNNTKVNLASWNTNKNNYRWNFARRTYVRKTSN
jgi:hypothetical protein